MMLEIAQTHTLRESKLKVKSLVKSALHRCQWHIATTSYDV